MVARVGTWKDNNLQIKYGREAVKLINYDNSNKFKDVAYICHGIIRWKRDMIHKWSNNILK